MKYKVVFGSHAYKQTDNEVIFEAGSMEIRDTKSIRFDNVIVTFDETFDSAQKIDENVVLNDIEEARRRT